MIDLHCHSTCSDGTLTPTQLMQMAKERGLKALAITDHDCMAGWAEAETVANDVGVEFVPGVELSTLHRGRAVHILGYFPDPVRLQKLLEVRLAARQRRATRMLERLAALGMPLLHPEWAATDAPGRPQMAEWMRQCGYVTSVREAFDRWIGEDKPAFIPYEPYSAAEGVRDLLACGAVPVWAHPGASFRTPVEALLPILLDAGLRGIEAHHPTHSREQVESLRAVARAHNLLITGGSDYHGPGFEADRAHGDLNSLALPWEMLEPIRSCARSL